MVKQLTYLLLNLYIGLFLLVGTGDTAWAQSRETNKLVKKGNEFYNNKKFNDAEVEYRKALDKDKKSFAGKFNLADALYKQGKYEDAAKIFQELSNSTKEKEELAKVHYNLGNAYLKQDKFRESVESYKKALKLNPKDEDTRYNLAYALKKIKQQQQNNQNQQNQKKQDQNKQDQNKQDQNKQDQENKDKQNQDQQNQNNQQQKEEENKNQKQNSNQLSEEQAKQMLEAIGQNEKETKDKYKKVPIRAKSGKPKRDW